MASSLKPEKVAKRVQIQILKLPDEKILCKFCKRSEINEKKLGPFYKYGKITLHYFCMVFSTGISQQTHFGEGILGFNTADIEADLYRCCRLKCTYCQKRGAAITCKQPHCERHMHFPCGLENRVAIRFMGQFLVFCDQHNRPRPRLGDVKPDSLWLWNFEPLDFTVLFGAYAKKVTGQLEGPSEDDGWEYACPALLRKLGLSPNSDGGQRQKPILILNSKENIDSSSLLVAKSKYAHLFKRCPIVMLERRLSPEPCDPAGQRTSEEESSYTEEAMDVSDADAASSDYDYSKSANTVTNVDDEFVNSVTVTCYSKDVNTEVVNSVVRSTESVNSVTESVKNVNLHDNSFEYDNWISSSYTRNVKSLDDSMEYVNWVSDYAKNVRSVDDSDKAMFEDTTEHQHQNLAQGQDCDGSGNEKPDDSRPVDLIEDSIEFENLDLDYEKIVKCDVFVGVSVEGSAEHDNFDADCEENVNSVTDSTEPNNLVTDYESALESVDDSDECKNLVFDLIDLVTVNVNSVDNSIDSAPKYVESVENCFESMEVNSVYTESLNSEENYVEQAKNETPNQNSTNYLSLSPYEDSTNYAIPGKYSTNCTTATDNSSNYANSTENFTNWHADSTEDFTNYQNLSDNSTNHANSMGEDYMEVVQSVELDFHNYAKSTDNCTNSLNSFENPNYLSEYANPNSEENLGDVDDTCVPEDTDSTNYTISIDTFTNDVNFTNCQNPSDNSTNHGNSMGGNYMEVVQVVELDFHNYAKSTDNGTNSLNSFENPKDLSEYANSNSEENSCDVDDTCGPEDTESIKYTTSIENFTNNVNSTNYQNPSDNTTSHANPASEDCTENMHSTEDSINYTTKSNENCTNYSNSFENLEDLSKHANYLNSEKRSMDLDETCVPEDTESTKYTTSIENFTNNVNFTNYQNPSDNTTSHANPASEDCTENVHSTEDSINYTTKSNENCTNYSNSFENPEDLSKHANYSNSEKRSMDLDGTCAPEDTESTNYEISIENSTDNVNSTENSTIYQNPLDNTTSHANPASEDYTENVHSAEDFINYTKSNENSTNSSNSFENPKDLSKNANSVDDTEDIGSTNYAISTENSTNNVNSTKNSTNYQNPSDNSTNHANHASKDCTENVHSANSAEDFINYTKSTVISSNVSETPKDSSSKYANSNNSSEDSEDLDEIFAPEDTDTQSSHSSEKDSVEKESESEPETILDTESEPETQDMDIEQEQEQEEVKNSDSKKLEASGEPESQNMNMDVQQEQEVKNSNSEKLEVPGPAPSVASNVSQDFPTNSIPATFESSGTRVVRMDVDEEPEGRTTGSSISSVDEDPRTDEEKISASDEESTTSEDRSSAGDGKVTGDSGSGLGFGPLILPTQISRMAQIILKEEMGIMLKDPSMIDSDSSGQDEGTRNIPLEVSRLPPPPAMSAAELEDLRSAEPGSDSSNLSSIPMSIEQTPMLLKKKRDESLSDDGIMGKKKKRSAKKIGSQGFGFSSGFRSDSAITRKKNVSGSGQPGINDEPIAGCSENGNMQMPEGHTLSPRISTTDSESFISHPDIPDLDNVLMEFESEVDPIEPNLPNEVFTNGQTSSNEALATSLSSYDSAALGIETDLSKVTLEDIVARAIEIQQEQYASQSDGNTTNAGRLFTRGPEALAQESAAVAPVSNSSITSSNSSSTSSNSSSTSSNSSKTSSNRSSTPTAGSSSPVASVPPPRQRPVAPPPVASTSAGPPAPAVASTSAGTPGTKPAAGQKKRPRITYDQILHSIVNYKRNMEKYLEQERNKPPPPPKKKPEPVPFTFGYVGPAKPGDAPKSGSKIFGDKSWERPLEPGPDEFPLTGPFDALMNRLAYDEEMKELAKDFTPWERDKPYKPLNR